MLCKYSIPTSRRTLLFRPSHPSCPPFSRRDHTAFAAQFAVTKPFVLLSYPRHIQGGV